MTDYVGYKQTGDGDTFPATADTTTGPGTAVTWFITSPGTYFDQAQNADGTGPASAPAKGPPTTSAPPVPSGVVPHWQLSG